MSESDRDLREGWKWMSLSDAAGKAQYGWTTKARRDGSVKLLRTTDITNGSVDWSSVPGCETPPPDISKYELHSGDIVVSRAGSVGFNYLMDDNCPAGVVFASYLMRLRPRDDVISPRYLKHYMKSARYWADVADEAVGIGMANLNASKLGAMQVPVPPRPAQDVICQYLDDVSARASIVRHHLASARLAIDRFRQSVLAAACSGRLTADWRATHPNIDVHALAADLAVRKANRSPQPAKAVVAIAEPDLPEIPRSWSWMSVDSIARAVVDGVHKTPNYLTSGIPFITVRNLTAGAGIDFERVKHISEADHRAFTARTKPERGDILVSKDGTLGVVRQIDTDREFSIFVSVAMVKPLLFEMSDYLVIALSSPQVQTQMVGVGSGLVHLVLRDLKADGVPVPPMEEQHQIVGRVRALMQLADTVSERIDRLSSNVDRAAFAVLSTATQGAPTIDHEGEQ